MRRPARGSGKLRGISWQQAGGKFFYFVTRETSDPAARLHARMMFYNGEDPATGSAAGCAAAWMVAHGVARPDERVLIEQGIEMQRPSHIFVRASRRDNRVVNVRVGGNAVQVLRGELSLVDPESREAHEQWLIHTARKFSIALISHWHRRYFTFLAHVPLRCKSLLNSPTLKSFRIFPRQPALLAVRHFRKLDEAKTNHSVRRR